MVTFQQNDISLESQWRSLILFGKNSATYKFAFAKSLLELVDKETTSISKADLAVPFAKHMTNYGYNLKMSCPLYKSLLY